MKSLTLAVESSTAIRDDYGMYDYGSYYCNYQSFRFTDDTTLFLSSNKVKHRDLVSKEAEDTEAVPLLRLHKLSSDPAFMISAEQGQQAWLVVSHYGEEQGVKGFKLSKGDIFRIGRSKILVKELQKPSTIKSLKAPSTQPSKDWGCLE